VDGAEQEEERKGDEPERGAATGADSAGVSGSLGTGDGGESPVVCRLVLLERVPDFGREDGEDVDVEDDDDFLELLGEDVETAVAAEEEATAAAGSAGRFSAVAPFGSLKCVRRSDKGV